MISLRSLKSSHWILLSWIIFFFTLFGAIGLDYTLRILLYPRETGGVLIAHGLPKELFHTLLYLGPLLAVSICAVGCHILCHSLKTWTKWAVYFLLLIPQLSLGFFLWLTICLIYLTQTNIDKMEW